MNPGGKIKLHMRMLLTLTACLGLALSASAAKHDDDQNNQQQYKKKGGNAPQQTVAPTGGNKVYGNKAYKTGPHQNFQQPNTVGGYNAINKGNKNRCRGQGTGNTRNTPGNLRTRSSNRRNETKTRNF